LVILEIKLTKAFAAPKSLLDSFLAGSTN